MDRDAGRPYAIFLPYLPLCRQVDVGEWSLSPISEYSGEWFNGRFQALTSQFIRSFRGPQDEPVNQPTLVSHSVLGCNGRAPTPLELNALGRAVEFSVLDQNPEWSAEGRAGTISAAQTLTTDNADIHVWPIDLVDAHVAQQYGFIVSTLAGGYQISDELVITPPEELRLPFGPVAIDGTIATAIYDTIVGIHVEANPHDAARIARTVSWLAKAWRNTPSISWEDRIVLLKTGFEALTQKSKTHETAASLRELFERVIVGEARLYATDHLLWSPNETSSRRFVGKDGKSHDCTDLEHWFRTFGQARNAIIHGDLDSGDLDYALDGSAYSGPMFHTAERLLREAIKVELTRLGHDRLYYEPTPRAVCEYLEGEGRPNG
jgi:hypothetical protein